MLLANWYHPILAIVFTFVALILMLVVLLQRGRGVGLAGAFGGAGGHTAFGAKTGDFLTWATIVIAGFFLLVAVLLNYVFVPLRTTFIAPPTVAPSVAPAPSETQQPVPSEPPPAQTPDATPAPAGTPTDTTPPAGAAEQPAGEPGDQPQDTPKAGGEGEVGLWIAPSADFACRGIFGADAA